MQERRARKQVATPVPEREGGAPMPGAPDPPTPRARAAHRCVPSRDAGTTLGDTAAAAGRRVHLCLLFARGCCHRGGDCPFLHRAPTVDDEAAAAADPDSDVFGRLRSTLPPDETTGTGALARACTSLYINWEAGGSAPPGWSHTLEAEARACGPVTRVHVMKGGAPVAFIEYVHRASAEFARQVFARQTLPGLPAGALPLGVRFAVDDPNPAAAGRLAAHRDAALVAGVRAAVAAGGGSATKRARLEGVYASQNLRAVGTDPHALERSARVVVPLAAPAALRDPGAWGGSGGEGETEAGGGDDDDDDDGDADAGLGGHTATWTAPPPTTTTPTETWHVAPACTGDDGDPAAAEAAGWVRDTDGHWVLGDPPAPPAAEAAADDAGALGALAAYDSDGSE